MTGSPNFMPESPRRTERVQTLERAAAELLTDVLDRVRLASGVFLRAEFSEPWAFSATDAKELADILQPGAERLVLMHMAVEGSFHTTLSSGESVLAQPGDAVVLPYSDDHMMGYPAGTPARPVAELLPAPPWTEMPVVRHGGGGATTHLFCGYLHCDDLLFNPVLNALPRLIHVRAGSGQAAQWRQASLRYAVEQTDRLAWRSSPLLARLPELVLVDCLRQYVESLPEQQSGWLAALKDPMVAKALVLLHAEPAEHWTVERLARQAAVSRSILAERFSKILGVSPMRYLAQWRLQLGSDLLRTTSLGLADIGERVGYDSEAAFSRAFKRVLGVSPAAWRQRQTGRARG